MKYFTEGSLYKVYFDAPSNSLELDHNSYIIDRRGNNQFCFRSSFKICNDFEWFIYLGKKSIAKFFHENNFHPNNDTLDYTMRSIYHHMITPGNYFYEFLFGKEKHYFIEMNAIDNSKHKSYSLSCHSFFHNNKVEKIS